MLINYVDNLKYRQNHVDNHQHFLHNLDISAFSRQQGKNTVTLTPSSLQAAADKFKTGSCRIVYNLKKFSKKLLFFRNIVCTLA